MKHFRRWNVRSSSAPSPSSRVRPPPAVQSLERRVLMAAGDLDGSFGGNDGKVVLPNAGSAADVAALAGNKVLVLSEGFTLTRLRADGGLDTSFSGGGKAAATFATADGLNAGRAERMAVLSDGGVVVAGTVGTNANPPPAGNRSDVALARFRSDGTPDPTFSGDGKLTIDFDDFDTVVDVAIAPGNKVVVLGRDGTLSRFNANGSLDTTFGGGDGRVQVMLGVDDPSVGWFEARAVAALPDGRVLVAARAGFDVFVQETQEVRRTTDFAFERFRADGSRDPTFNGDQPAFFGPETGVHIGATAPYDLLLLPDGRFVANGITADQPYNDGTQYAVGVFAADGTIIHGRLRSEQGEFGQLSRLAPTADGGFVELIDVDHGVGRVHHPDFTTIAYDFDSVAGVAVAPDGKVVVVGRPFFGDNGLLVARYRATDPLPADPDDQIAEANSMAVGTPVTGRIIDRANDVDLFRFTARAGEALEFDADPAGGESLTPALRLFRADGTPLFPTGYIESDRFRHEFAAAGTYYVGASSFLNAEYNATDGTHDTGRPGSPIGKYVLRSTRLGFTADGDDQMSEAAPLNLPGGSGEKSIAFDRDVDMFRFDATAGQRIGLDVESAGVSGLDSLLRLFDAAGNELARNDNAPSPDESASSAGDESYLQYAVATSGTYYVGVSGSPNGSYNPATGDGDAAGSTGAFQLILSEVFTPEPPPPTDPRVPVLAEAETARLGGAVLANHHPGFTGTGYVDVVNASGDFIEWTVTAHTAGLHQVDFRYANGGSTSRPMQLHVDGQLVSGQGPFFRPTGSWATWAEASAVLRIGSPGQHRIRLTAAGSSGPNIDSMRYRSLGLGEFQAEHATRQGAVVSNAHPGFRGSGYADFVNASGDFVEWAFDAPTGGTYSLDVRYANGGSTARRMRLSVDGVTVTDNFTFGPTGSWSTWGALSRQFELGAGRHTVRLTAIGASGPNVDSLTVH